MKQEAPFLGRVAVRQRRNREALLNAGHKLMSQKGFDKATMHEIAAMADVGAGTVYSYFQSKEILSIAVLENLMCKLVEEIEAETNGFADAAEVYAYSIQTVIETATSDESWKQLLHRSEVMAGAMFRCMGTNAIRDLERAKKAGRIKINDAKLTWILTTHAIVGLSLGIVEGTIDNPCKYEAVVRLLNMTGIDSPEAKKIASRTKHKISLSRSSKMQTR